MEFWIFLLVIFVLWLTVNLIKGLAQWFTENMRYHRILRESADKLADIDLKKYEIQLAEFEKFYESDKRKKIVLKDKMGEAINICPKCGGYMKIVQGRRGTFLGCSSYPNCKSYRKYEAIFNLEV